MHKSAHYYDDLDEWSKTNIVLCQYLSIIVSDVQFFVIPQCAMEHKLFVIDI